MVVSLALPLEGGTSRQPEMVIRVNRRTAGVAAQAGGGTVLLYHLVTDAFVVFRGIGRIAALEYGAELGPVLCRIDDYRGFAAPVVGEAESRVRGVRSMLWLDAERVAEIVAQGTAPGPPAGMEEPASVFDADRTFAAIEEEVLRRWDSRCAVTGEQVPASGGSVPLFVVPIRPRTLGGPLHVRNFLPMVEVAARAWTFGHISAGPQLDMLAVLDALELDLLERMHSEGKLLVPAVEDWWPDPEHLAFHRTHVFAH